MPKGKPNPQTIASSKYHKKAGYKAIAFKLRGDLPDKFSATCERLGRSKASVISELMQDFVDANTEC